MGTTVGAVIDYLVTNLAAPATAAISDALVIDAYTNDDLSPHMIWIGRPLPVEIDSAAGDREIPVMGRRTIDEEWDIGSFIDCKAEGTAQKTSRDQAIALFDVVAHLIGTDPSLGGLLVSGWYIELPLARMIQVDPEKTAWTRTVIAFTARVRNRYQA